MNSMTNILKSDGLTSPITLGDISGNNGQVWKLIKLVDSGASLYKACIKLGIDHQNFRRNFPSVSEYYRELRHKRTMAIYAEIIEVWVTNNFCGYKELCRITGYTIMQVKEATDRYFRKPDTDITLQSKV